MNQTNIDAGTKFVQIMQEIQSGGWDGGEINARACFLENEHGTKYDKGVILLFNHEPYHFSVWDIMGFLDWLKINIVTNGYDARMAKLSRALLDGLKQIDIKLDNSKLN